MYMYMVHACYNTSHETNGDSEVTFDLSPLADDGHFVDEGRWMKKITQVDKRPTHHDREEGGGGECVRKKE